METSTSAATPAGGGGWGATEASGVASSSLPVNSRANLFAQATGATQQSKREQEKMETTPTSTAFR